MVVQFNYRNLFGFSKDSLFTFQCTSECFVSILCSAWNDLNYIMYCLLCQHIFEIFFNFFSVKNID